MNKEINIIFPNQLFQKSEIIQNKKDTYIIEENLFFNQYKFHKHKIAYHRSSMQKYKDYLISKKIKVIYIDSQDKLSDIRNFIKQNHKDLKKINLYDPADNWLLKRLNLYSKNIELNFFENPLFLNT
ncbi:MAG: cryptochrome/photolyase family protein, partial [Candidatus Marinimicrobia bacterium]|nr:cryptochrome/photolyase family protein [Candidatus Neomarinimicrobiota bacterium]